MKKHPIVSSIEAAFVFLVLQTFSQIAYPQSTDCVPFPNPEEIVDVAMCSYSNEVYTWFSTGMVAKGSFSDFDLYQHLFPYNLPQNKYPRNIVGIGIREQDPTALGGSGSPSVKVYVWYDDSTYSIGSPEDLGKYSNELKPYTLPAGYGTDQIVGMSIDDDMNRFGVFFSDGTSCAGDSPSRLNNFRPLNNYISLPSPYTPNDIVGMATDGVIDDEGEYAEHVYGGNYKGKDLHFFYFSGWNVSVVYDNKPTKYLGRYIRYYLPK
ncbi:MAG: hypothetical protein IPL49_21150 [Saprospirales bacterium]|nr:hypothetical protein [Saprospirales bacterium]